MKSGPFGLIHSERSTNLTRSRRSLKAYPSEPLRLPTVRAGRGVKPLTILIQFGLALLAAAACALIHAAGLYGISKLFHLEDKELEKRSAGLDTIWLVVIIALAIFLLHLSEIGLFAGLYMLIGATASLEEALLFSMASYTTAGSSIVQLGETWRLLGITEALAGFLLIGWSTAYLVAKLRKIEA